MMVLVIWLFFSFLNQPPNHDREKGSRGWYLCFYAMPHSLGCSDSLWLIPLLKECKIIKSGKSSSILSVISSMCGSSSENYEYSGIWWSSFSASEAALHPLTFLPLWTQAETWQRRNRLGHIERKCSSLWATLLCCDFGVYIWMSRISGLGNFSFAFGNVPENTDAIVSSRSI